MNRLNKFEQDEPQENEVSLFVSGGLKVPDYIYSKPFNIEKQQEDTRSRIAERLITMFSATLVTTYIFVGAAAFNPNADKAFIKDITAQVIAPQAGLLGGILLYYFKSKKS